MEPWPHQLHSLYDNDRSDFSQPAIPLLALWDNSIIVGKMEVPPNFQEPFSGYARSYRVVVKTVTCGPIVIQVWQPIHPHVHKEPEVSLDLF